MNTHEKKRDLEFQLSAEEEGYLKQLASEDKTIANLLRFEQGTHGRRVAVCTDRSAADRLRGWLTERLAAVGFDTDYSLNTQGLMLEKLIDRFFVE